jgi:hypothetical protein
VLTNVALPALSAKDGMQAADKQTPELVEYWRRLRGGVVVQSRGLRVGPPSACLSDAVRLHWRISLKKANKMTLLRELPEDARPKVVDLGTRQQDIVRNLFIDLGNRAVAFLSAILLAGLFVVVAIARGRTMAPRAYAISLACFLAGLLALAVVTALNYETSRLVMLRVANRWNRIYRSELPVEAADAPAIRMVWAHITSGFGYIALLLWMIGAYAGYKAFTSIDISAAAPIGAFVPQIPGAIAPPPTASAASLSGAQAQIGAAASSQPRPPNGWSVSDRLALIGGVVGFGQFAALFFTVLVMRKTASRQLRAYIFPHTIGLYEGSKMTPPQPNHQNVPGVIIELKNFGQTPGYRTVSWAEVAVIEPINEDKLVVPPIEERFSLTLPSNGGSTKSLWFQRPLTVAEIADIQSGVRAIYLYGRIEYRDVHRKKRYSNIRVAYSGPFPPATLGVGFSFCDKGNEAD